MMDIKQVFGLNMRRLRLPRGLSQEETADLTELGRAQISSIERGRQNVTLHTIDRISRVLKCDWRELFDREAARRFAAAATTKAPRRKPGPRRRR
jgi:transcriptional regulator with XRE-family HTH domain